MSKRIINKDGSNVKQDDTSSAIRFGLYHANNYYIAPRAFRELKWVLRFNGLTYKEISVIDSMFGFWGDEGLFPSIGKVAKEFGISRGGISQVLNRFNSSKLKCPICNKEWGILHIEWVKVGGEFRSSNYDFSQFLNFLRHIKTDHTIEDEIEASKNYQKENAKFRAKKEDESEF